MAITKETLHFTLGENAGALLAQIAQEHLLYDRDIKKAVETITQSLIGVPNRLVMQILKGDVVLTVENDQFSATKYDPVLHSKIFSRLDCADFTMRKLREITEAGKELPTYLEQLSSNIRYFGTVSVDISYDSIFDLVGGNSASILEEVLADHEISRIERHILASKAYLETAAQDIAIIHFMKTAWPEEFESIKDDLDYQMYSDSAKVWIEKVANSLAELFNSEYVKSQVSSSMQQYIDSALAIDKAIEDGLKPVDIMENYSAGWLSPDGEYYALNGEIANMLHNQIASALFDSGIIPNTKENRENPDNWLQTNGWVRIHGNEIDFEAHMNERLNRGENKFMTTKQVDMIADYCYEHHAQIVKVFFQPINALVFKNVTKSESGSFYRQYLNW
jgi:hypothetical protein